MALSSDPAPMVIADSSLTDWVVIGSGGFGQIYKTRHRTWCCDVAIKLLYHDDGTSASLLREINMMRQGSCPYVIQVRGLFKGRVPSTGMSIQLGLVMDYMERGSLFSLQKTLGGTPPWPLVFRLAHQVALGINYLHSLSPAVLHLDLKPSNVLLDSSLDAKLTDFGLARFSRSVTRSSKKDTEEEGGTTSYMPPEAFDVSYSPTRSSDIYSYGILLWSIVTGRHPYANAMSSIVRLRIPQGDRPSLDDIRSQASGLAGLTRLMDLMERCWEARPNQRPSAYCCTTETEELYKMHKHAIIDAVHQVLKTLDKREEERLAEHIQRIQIAPVSENDYVPTGRLPVQEMAGGWPTNQGETARVKDPPSPQPANLCDTDLGRSSTGDKVKVSSVHPIQLSPPPALTGRSPQGRKAETPHQAFRPNIFPQRQFSIPDSFPNHLPTATRPVNIHLCNVTGFQYGNYNSMTITNADPSERRRHPTAPSSVNLPPPHSGSRRDKMGGVG